MTIEIISMFVRALIYFWISLESFFLFHIYKYGYYNYKPTTIISSLCALFYSIGIFFLVLDFATIVGTLHIALIQDMQRYGLFALFSIPIGVFLVKFRVESFKEIPKNKKPLE